MQSELASWGADLLLLAAGFGVLLGIGLVPRGSLAALGATGLAYLVGSAVVPIVLTLLLVLGVPFTILTFLFVVIACIALGAWRIASLPPRKQRREQVGRWTSWRSWGPETWLGVAFVVLFSTFALMGLLNALAAPLVEWDAWTIWGRKAQILTEHDSLWQPFFQSKVYRFGHLDYPLQLPIWEAIHFRAADQFDTQAILGHLWLFLVAFIWGMAYLLHSYVRVRPIVWAPILLLVAVAPGVWEQSNGDADLPLAIFAGVGVASLAYWLLEEDRRMLGLAAIMLAAAANTKNEGGATVATILAIALVIVLARKLDWRAFLVAAVGVIAVGIAPWRLWLAANDIKTDIPIGKGLDPGYLVDRAHRIGPSIDAVNAQLADQSRWVYLLPLAALMVAFALFSGIGRRIASFYLAIFVVIWAVFIWTYWISPYPLNWHLETSAPRVVSVPMFICIAAVLHLSGLFVARIGRVRIDLSSGPKA